MDTDMDYIKFEESNLLQYLLTVTFLSHWQNDSLGWWWHSSFENRNFGVREGSLGNAVQFSGFVPHWREQRVDSSSKAVRIFAFSLLWLSSLQERHVAPADSSITTSGSRAVTSHLWGHLTHFKKGVLVVRTEHTYLPEWAYLEPPRAGQLGLSSSLLGSSQRLWAEISVWGKRHYLENVKPPGVYIIMMSQQKFF